jgi:hypothetical protein
MFKKVFRFFTGAEKLAKVRDASATFENHHTHSQDVGAQKTSNTQQTFPHSKNAKWVVEAVRISNKPRQTRKRN